MFSLGICAFLLVNLCIPPRECVHSSGDLDDAFAEYTDNEEDGEGGDDEEDGEGGDDDDEEDGEGGDDDEQTVNYRELDEAFLSGDTDHTWYYGDESDEDGSHSSGPSILYHSEESSDSSEF